MRRMLHLRVITHGNPRARLQVLCGDEGVVYRIPQTEIQRQPPEDGPLILRIDVVLRCLLIRTVWPVPDRYRLRYPVAECVRDGLVDVVRVVVLLLALA